MKKKINEKPREKTETEWEKLTAEAKALDMQGHGNRAVKISKKALDIAEKQPNRNRINVAESHKNLAGLYCHDLVQAEKHYRLAREIIDKAKGKGSACEAEILRYIADQCWSNSRGDMAAIFHMRLVKIKEKEYGCDHSKVAKFVEDLAGRYASEGYLFKEACEFEKILLKIMEKKFGPYHPKVAKVLDDIAYQYAVSDNHAMALPFQERLLAIKEKTLGLDHPDVAQELINLAECYCYQKKYAQAEPHFNRALSVLEKSLGPDHGELVGILSKLAEMYRLQGRRVEIESLRKRIQAIFEKEHGVTLPNVVKRLEDTNSAALKSDPVKAANEFEKLCIAQWVMRGHK